jgi:hypothetical protein
LQSDYKEHETIRHYLLGQATQENSSSLEERLLTDSALFQALLIVEDELVDQYLSDKLTPAERQSFETHFLIPPERQRKLRFGRALHKYVNFAAASEALEQDSGENVSDGKPDVAQPPPKRGFFSFLPFSNPAVSYSLAAAMLLIVAGISWVVFNNWRQQAPHQPENVYVVTLTPGLTRDSGELKRLSVPADTDTVQLRLELPSTRFLSYRAEVVDVAGKLILLEDEIKSADTSPKFVELNIRHQLLAPGDYQVKVSGRLSGGGSESIGSYPFRVTR